MIYVSGQPLLYGGKEKERCSVAIMLFLSIEHNLANICHERYQIAQGLAGHGPDTGWWANTTWLWLAGYELGVLMPISISRIL